MARVNYWMTFLRIVLKKMSLVWTPRVFVSLLLSAKMALPQELYR